MNPVYIGFCPNEGSIILTVGSHVKATPLAADQDLWKGPNRSQYLGATLKSVQLITDLGKAQLLFLINDAI